uniref:Protein TIC 214 n=1 Tax=Echeandia sp. Steele 1101 TaxID=1133553 RepID=H2F5R2_9ASPA|nr:hypothetical chloroplast RF19 [Echeandia sp. Steele 1101]APO11859.1 hypothetical chloroplast RF19 [Echeandia sp. Steele 1101]
MILKSFLLGNLLCMKIINSVVVVGLYYGFLTTFSIGPSYLLLLRARVLEEGTEKEVSATTGFITGQLMMFISIYYAPLHLALGRPHTITVLVLPYLLFHFFWNNHKNFFYDGSTTRNSMRNLSIQCVFLNNLIFQLFNHFILPSSTLARLVNIYMFRCNNKMLFVTSSFVGWLIGHVLFMKWVGLVLFWIRQNYSIRPNKYLVAKLKNEMARIFSILLFITCVYYLGRMPSPIFTKKLEEREKRKEESNVETTYEEDKDSPVYENSYLDTHQDNWEFGKEKNEKTYFSFEKPFVTFLFDYKRWNRPVRYIKNDRFENAVRNEMSQYFFYICTSNGKQKISFTYPPSLSTFLEMVERKISLYTTEKLSPKDLYNYWVYTNEQKKCNLNNELISRIKILEKEKGFLGLDMLEKRTRLCDDENEQEYLPKIYDPFLNGPCRGTIKKLNLREIMNDLILSTTDSIEILWINKIHDLFNDSREQEINELSFEHTQRAELDLESQAEPIFDVITTDRNDVTRIRKKSIGLEKISKRVPRWSYKLIDDVEEEEEENQEEEEDLDILSREGKRVVIYSDVQSTKSSAKNKNNNDDNDDNDDNDKNDDTSISDEEEEIALTRYPQQSDFDRDLIKGSMRAQRRKTIIRKNVQPHVHSPLFLDRGDKLFYFSFFDISEIIHIFRNINLFRNWVGGNSELQTSYFEEEKREEKSFFELKKEETEEDRKKNKKEQAEERQILIAEIWDAFIFTQAMRGFLLLTQSFLRKRVILPLLIIAKNIGRMLLFQYPEWYEDWKEWQKEMHVKCTYNGVQLSETEFPKDWLMDGIQIKILYPFRLKPWQRSKIRSHRRDQKMSEKEKNYFLTVWGGETDVPFGDSLKRPSFFKPIFQELKKKMKKAKKAKKHFFQVIRVFKERIKFLKITKEKTRWVAKIVRVKNLIMKELEKINSIFLLKKVKVYETNENRKNFNINNKIIHESPIQIRSMNCVNENSSLIETKMKDLANKIITIKAQIKGITKEKKKVVLTCNDKNKRSESQKDIWKIFKRKNIRLIRKSHFFIKSFIEKIYVNILLCIIKIPRTNVQLFFESTKKIIKKSIYNAETSQEGPDKSNENAMNFILTTEKSFSNTNKNFNIYCDLSSLSQTYVFYKLSQNQLLNNFHLRSVLQYHNTRPFLRDIIKNYCMTQGIFNYKPRHKKIHKSRMNKWKIWLRNHYQYNLSRTEWSYLDLVSKKWKNRVNRYRTIQNKKKDSMKLDSYKKKPLSHYMKQNYYTVDLLMTQKEKLQKHYRYDLLSYKYMNYVDSKDSYIYGSTLQVKEKKITYNLNTLESESLYELISIAINNYLKIDRNKILYRKFFNYRILNFFLRNNIETLTNTYTKIHKNDKKETQNSQKKNFFDWMGMNQERLHPTISNLEPWFFPELGLLFETYKNKPWIIPIKLLIFHFPRNANISQSEKIDIKKKNEKQGKEDLVSDLRKKNKKKGVKEDYKKTKIKKGRKKKRYKSKKEAELDFFLKKYFLFQLAWEKCLDERMINNIEIYCFLLRLTDINQIAISSIRKGEINLDTMLIQKEQNITELVNRGIFIIEPVRLSMKRDGKNIIYQTISISLVDKNKHQTNGKCIIKNEYYDFLVPENILSPRRRRELRILICFNYQNRNWNVVDRNPQFCNQNKIKNIRQFLNEEKHLNTETNKLIKFKLFLWPNYRLEDLACMNRYWFDTNNGSHFSMSRIHMYPRFKIS